MKRLLMLAAIVATSAGNLPGSPNQSSPAHKQDVAQQAPANAPPVTVVIENGQRGEPAKTSAPQAPQGDTTPEWVLVFVGVVTAVFIGWQSWETRRSAQAVKDSLPHQKNAADAALLNAQALINSERPWVMIQIETIPDREGKAKATFLTKVFNYGKGPAHVTHCSKVKIEFLRQPNTELKVPPVYEPQPDWQKRFLPPPDSFPLELINPWDETVKDLKATVAFGNQPVNYGELVLIAYGKIEYTDGISSKTYATAF